MVIPKYTAEESLERIKLMMKYDNSTTLSENKIIIFEQNNIEKTFNEFNYQIDKSYTDEDRVVNIISGLTSSDNFEKFLGKFGTERGKTFLHRIRKAFGFMDKGEIEKLTTVLSNFGYTLKTPFSIGDNRASEWSLEKTSGNSNAQSETTGNSNDQSGTKYVECTGTNENPFELYCYEKDKKGPLHKVQTCLDVTPDGKFGKNTEDALFKKMNVKTFTKDDVGNICKEEKKVTDQNASNPVTKNDVEELGDYSTDYIEANY